MCVYVLCVVHMCVVVVCMCVVCVCVVFGICGVYDVYMWCELFVYVHI